MGFKEEDRKRINKFLEPGSFFDQACKENTKLCYLFYEEDLELMKSTMYLKGCMDAYLGKSVLRTSLIKSKFGDIGGDVFNCLIGDALDSGYHFEKNFFTSGLITPIIADKELIIKQVIEKYKVSPVPNKIIILNIFDNEIIQREVIPELKKRLSEEPLIKNKLLKEVFIHHRDFKKYKKQKYFQHLY